MVLCLGQLGEVVGLPLWPREVALGLWRQEVVLCLWPEVTVVDRQLVEALERKHQVVAGYQYHLQVVAELAHQGIRFPLLVVVEQHRGWDWPLLQVVVEELLFQIGEVLKTMLRLMQVRPSNQQASCLQSQC